jgi:hypothetical protein
MLDLFYAHKRRRFSMSPRSARIALLSRMAAWALVPLACFALTGVASAKDKKPIDVKAKCEKEVREKIKAKHPGAHDIQLTFGREWQQTSTQSGVGGTGTLKASNNSGREFEWTCVYDTTKNKIVDVSVEKHKRDKKK